MMSSLACPARGRNLPQGAIPCIVCPFCGKVLTLAGETPPQMWMRNGVDVRRLAMWQRLLSWAVSVIGLNLLLLIFVPSSPTASTIGTILLGVATFAWCLNIVVLLIAAAGVLGAVNASRTTIAILIVALLVPPSSGFALLITDILALRQLRRAGLRVGFFGIKDEEVVRVLSAALCGQCGYNLTGNVSGRCPECGTPVPQPPLAQRVS